MRILVVEDEVKLADAIKKGLEQEGFAVDAVNDADEGVGMATSGDYDLVILDRMLGGMIEGTDIVKEMRAEHIQAPVIFLTAKDTINDRVEGLNVGADDYLVKPFAFDELVARARALLRRPQQEIGTLLKCSDLELDPGGKTVKRAGRSINLSAKEFALLEYMLRNQNRTLTKQHLITHVWDFDADILPNTVEVYIGYLRTKVDKPFKGPNLIHTSRGFGYKLGVEK